MRRVLATLAAGCLWASAQEPAALNPVQWSLSAPSSVKAGERITARLTASIAEGWHLYSLRKIEGGPIPPTIAVPAPQPFRLIGVVDAPVPLAAHEEAFGMEVEFYFGEVEFHLPLEAARDLKPGPVKLAVTARFQVCDNTQCLPPRTVRLEQTVQATSQ